VADDVLSGGVCMRLRSCCVGRFIAKIVLVRVGDSDLGGLGTSVLFCRASADEERLRDDKIQKREAERRREVTPRQRHIHREDIARTGGRKEDQQHTAIAAT